MSDTPPLPEKLRNLLTQAVQADASDLHLIVGYPPVQRVHGDLLELPEPPLTAEEAESLLGFLCPEELRGRLNEERT